MEGKVKVTIESDGKTQGFECDAFACAAVFRKGETGLRVHPFWSSMKYNEILRVMSAINHRAYNVYVDKNAMGLEETARDMYRFMSGLNDIIIDNNLIKDGSAHDGKEVIDDIRQRLIDCGVRLDDYGTGAMPVLP